MAKKAEKRLRDWLNTLAEMAMFGVSTREEFDERAREYSAKQFKAEPFVAKSLSRAAEFFKLDKTKPAHRALLLGILADVLFGDPRRVGRPKGKNGIAKRLWSFGIIGLK